MSTTESDAVEREVRIDASPEDIFPFLIDPAKMVRWQGRSATLDPRPGGVYRLEMNDTNIALGEYIEVTPNSRVVFSWGWKGEDSAVPPGSSRVEITLTPDGDGTIVRLHHSGLPESQRDAHLEGWTHYLDRLAIAGAGGEPEPES
jgi:uncharacterized protein YndB with AHSA1/START domain